MTLFFRMYDVVEEFCVRGGLLKIGFDMLD